MHRRGKTSQLRREGSSAFASRKGTRSRCKASLREKKGKPREWLLRGLRKGGIRMTPFAGVLGMIGQKERSGELGSAPKNY